MNEVVRDWLLGFIGASMILAITEYLVPEGVYKKIVVLAGGLVLILVSLALIPSFREMVPLKEMDKLEGAVQDELASLELRKEFLYETIIAERTQAYILDKANELGICCEVSVSVAWDGDLPVPYSVVIKGNWDQEQYLSLSKLIETELGISKTLQRFEEVGQ